MRILVLGSYPTQRPIHGGQIRLSEIVAAYRTRGFRVRQVNVYPASVLYRSGWRLLGNDTIDLPLPPERLQSWRGLGAPLIEDLASGELLATDERRLAQIERYAGRVDAVHLEQPWLLPVVERLRRRGALGTFRLVYGSQNIEQRLKREIFRQYRVAHGEPLINAISALERQAASEADLVAAVTEEDASEIARWTHAPIILAANGIQPWRGRPRAVARWRRHLGAEPFALYVASAHPPNVIGFCEAFGESLAALSLVQRVVVAGSVAEHIRQSDWFRRWEPLNAGRMVALGVLSTGQLDALKDMAHTFVLPVTAGGGSNLKTAEALYACRNVVATPLALRGFESFAALPGVTVAAPGGEFGSAVSRSLNRPLPAPDSATDVCRQRLTWSHTLAPLTLAVASL